MDLFPRPLRSSRALSRIPKDYDTTQTSRNASNQDENTVANREAKAPIDYQHPRGETDDLDLDENAIVEQRGKAIPGHKLHVVVAVRANVEVVRQFPVEQHGSALGTLGPQVLRNFPPRKQRVDLGSDVVGNPVHARAFGSRFDGQR